MRKYRPFIIGIILGALVVLGVIYVTGGTVLNAREKNYYSGLDKAYGKYYEIIKIIDE